jgi:hypothetical protein
MIELRASTVWRDQMSRMMADCRRFPSESNCSLVIIGEEDEVARAAAEHAISVHGHPDSPETHASVHDFLEPAENYTFDARPQESMST